MNKNVKTKIIITSPVKLSDELISKLNTTIGTDLEVKYEVDKSRFKERIIVTSAIELEQKTKDEIIKKFGEADYVFEIDEKVIGGVRIKTENQLFDGTIKSKLEALRKNLND